jgi:hypothetical protein
MNYYILSDLYTFSELGSLVDDFSYSSRCREIKNYGCQITILKQRIEDIKTQKERSLRDNRMAYYHNCFYHMYNLFKKNGSVVGGIMFNYACFDEDLKILGLYRHPSYSMEINALLTYFMNIYFGKKWSTFIKMSNTVVTPVLFGYMNDEFPVDGEKKYIKIFKEETEFYTGSIYRTYIYSPNKTFNLDFKFVSNMFSYFDMLPDYNGDTINDDAPTIRFYTKTHWLDYTITSHPKYKKQVNNHRINTSFIFETSHVNALRKLDYKFHRINISTLRKMDH